MSCLLNMMRLERSIFVRCLARPNLSPRRAFILLSTSRWSPYFSNPSSFHPQTLQVQLQSTIRCFSTGDPLSAESLQEAIMQHIEKSDVVTAYQALVRLEKTMAPGNVPLDTYTTVLDGWAAHQQHVPEGPHQVNEMFHAADRAQAIFEKLEHKLTSEENSIVRPTQHHYNVVLDAWLRVTRTMLELDVPLRGIPQRAQRVLERMQQQAAVDPTIQPTIHHYNAVLETWGNSPEHLRATLADNLFQQLPSLGLEPNNETYVIMIRAWCRSKQDRAAFNATGHLMKVQRLMAEGLEGMELTMKEYKTILEAWTRAGDKLAPQKAFGVIKLMQKAYMDRVSEIRPDEECYKLVLATYARSTLPNLGHDVDELIDQMEDRVLTPDSECYRFAIQTWKNTAINFFNEGTQHDDATRASRLLTRMEKAYHRSSNVVVQPTTEDFNNVIQAWSTSTKAGAAVHAESLLKKMEKAYADGNANLKPNADSYRWALEAWASSPSRDKLNHAVTILSRMKDLIEGSEDDHAKPTVDVFNAFIHACGTTEKASSPDKKYNLKLAVNTVEEMRKRGEAPNSATFRLLLEACENLLPLGKKRSRAVENIFKNCCYLGLIDDEVLAQFKKVAPEELYADLVVANTTEDEAEGTRSSKMVPESWTRNVGVKVVTEDGKKPKPLNIDAVFVVTKRVKEFRVKRLRQKKNKRLLRSGRNLYVKNSRMAN